MIQYNPMPGDYGLVQTNGTIGFLIQLGTFSKFNHAFIYEGNDTIIEATPRLGIKRSPVSTYKDIVWNRQDHLTDDQRRIIVETAQRQVGKKYFFGDIVIIAARILRLPVPKIILHRLDARQEFREICSGMVAVCYRAAGLDPKPDTPAYFITPSDLLYRLLFC